MSGSDPEFVPDDVIPHQHLPPLEYRDMPEAIPWKAMIGPSIILAGLSLGSGEFMLWPHITYKAGFVFFWACLLGVLTQFFLNMEIERYTLVTGESVITGFSRLSKHWAWIMLICNIVPMAWPGWASGAATTLSWLLYGAQEVVVDGEIQYQAAHANWFAIAGLILVGIVLTSGPVVYNTVEKIQTFLVALIMVAVVLLAFLLVKPYAISEMLAGAVKFGEMPPPSADLAFVSLLGALAFAGAGGTLNLGQSNYIKDKGYGMGKYIGRITSPITGQTEASPEVGYHFKHTDDNLARWKQWWRAANIEHFLSFFVTCLLCLALLSLISYSIFYDAGGALKPGMDKFGKDMNFIWGEATTLGTMEGGQMLKVAFLIMGTAILLTTELGVLDVISRISADIVKVNYLRDNENWSVSKLYFLFLWGEIALGVTILMTPGFAKPLFLIKISAALQGGVMFVYSILLLWMNNKVLSRSLSMSPLRFVAIIWSCAFFGYFSFMVMKMEVMPILFEIIS
ncbi:MAG: Nramp family divalent metal transporter [Planctomycetaceae bacterium]|nr:Nramp family divalent metal transporter [Planctomycetaceae bacterium]